MGLLKYLTTAVGSLARENCFCYVGYGRGADPEQDVESALISSHSLMQLKLFWSCEETEFSPSAGESHINLCVFFFPSEQGGRTLGGLERNLLTKSVRDFKVSVFKAVVTSSVALDRTKSSLLAAAWRDQGEETEQVLSGQISLVHCWRPGDAICTPEHAVAGQEATWNLIEEGGKGK